MPRSNCTISFYRNDLQKTRPKQGKCPVKNCAADIDQNKAPFQRYKGKMRYLPFCSEHGIRIHNNGFVYYNGPSGSDLTTSTRRNLMFHGQYYVDNFLKTATNWNQHACAMRIAKMLCLTMCSLNCFQLVIH